MHFAQATDNPMTCARQWRL